MEWTTKDSEAANLEGWDLFDCDGSENGPLQLHRIDDPVLWREDHGVEIAMEWAEDNQAWVFVYSTPSPLHTKALAVLGDQNPMELAAIERWNEAVSVIQIRGDWGKVLAALDEHAPGSSVAVQIRDQLGLPDA